jgi:hypothetical protein
MAKNMPQAQKDSAMPIAISLAATTMLYTPWPAPLAYALERDTMTEALIDFERRYAHELGYALGPAGEWIAHEPAGRAAAR